MTATVLLVDDHPVFRKGLRLLLEEEGDLTVVGEAGNGKEAIALAREHSPDVIVMDITMPGLSGIEATRLILSASPDTKVVALSIHSGKQFVEDMLRAGALGYILKESAPEDLVTGLRSVMRGQVYLSSAIAGVVVSQYMNALSPAKTSAGQMDLTSRELEIARLIAEGSSSKGIAGMLKISAKTVDSTRRRIMKKLGVKSVAELVEIAREHRWLAAPEHAPAGETGPPSILRTKLHRPPVPPDHVARSQILKRITNLDERLLTLISAPAGYGKSTLASHWLESCDSPHAWLSLDEDDNDLRRFVSCCISAIQTVFPDACRKTGALFKASHPPPRSVLVDSLINDLDRVDESFVLVLDDYHLIREKEVHDLLTDLLSHPPRNMHLALLTRRNPPLPLSTLRGLGQMNEVSAAHLRFSFSETAEFLKHTQGLSLDEATAKVIDEKIEGWPTGLRLIAHSLADGQDLNRVVKGLQGGFSAILDYLIAEVLSRQPLHLSEYLLKTAVVDRFCAPLCDALSTDEIETGGETVEGSDFIEWLQTNNMFVIALDAENRWFRYHHLFLELLQNQLKSRLDPDEVGSLHGRAGEWFDQNGLVDEAIEHALAGKDVEGAVRLVERNRQAVHNTDRCYILQKWLAMFPDAVMQQYPELLMARAWVHYHQFEIPAIPTVIEAAETLLGDTPGNSSLHGEIDFFRGYLTYFLNDGPRSLRHLREARKKVPKTHREIIGQIELLHALASQMQGQADKALARLNDLLSLHESTQDSGRTRLLVAPVYMHIISGALDEAFSANRHLYNYSAMKGYEYARVWSVYLRGLIHFYQNDLPSAIDQLGQAVEKKYLLHTRAVVDSMAGLAYAYQATGQSDQAGATMRLLSEYVDSIDDPAYSTVARSCRVRMSIMQGEPVSGESWLPGSPPPTENMVWWLEIPVVTHCRALLAEGSDDNLDTAGILLEQLLKLNKDNHNTCHRIQIVPLLAMAREKQGRTEKALDLLEEAVELSAPGRWIRPYLECGSSMVDLLKRLKAQGAARSHIKIILSAFKESEAALAAPVSSEEGIPAETQVLLSMREVEILSQVAKGLSNKEIAAALHISVETVKKHLYNTYQKLEVDSRITALAKARELGILRRG